MKIYTRLVHRMSDGELLDSDSFEYHGPIASCDPVSATLIAASATVGSSLIGAHASNRAAQSQTDAANQANDLQWRMYNQNRDDMAPWRQAGVGALGQLTTGIADGGKFNRDFTMDDFQQDPGYEFRLNEGYKALERSRAAKGMLYSGATAKAVTNYAQGAASNEYTNAFNRYMAQRDAQYNRLAGVAGTGQTATQQVGAQGQNLATNVGNNLMNAGNARASGYVGQANAINSGIGNGYNMWQQYMSRNNNPPLVPGNYGTPSDPLYG